MIKYKGILYSYIFIYFFFLMVFPIFSIASSSQTVSYQLFSGIQGNETKESVIAFSDLLQVKDAPWIRLHFSDWHFGNNSYLTITSMQDADQQRLDTKSMTNYRNSSVFFNGDTVKVDLHVAPGDQKVFFSINSITAGKSDDGDLVILSICSGDSRVASTDKAVGRILSQRLSTDDQICTGWIASNGALLTAGHCANDLMDIIQFNVPPSDCYGNIGQPLARDQYPIDPASITSVNDGTFAVGQDWAVFSCLPNSETGLLPIQGQNSFYRLSLPQDNSISFVRVTGYGRDYTPAGCGDFFNERNYAQQTDFGEFIEEVVEGSNDVYITYRADTEGGGSGSPVIQFGTNRAIGIHEDGGCTASGGANDGTSFENDELEQALQDFHGSNVAYVDYYFQNYPQEGTVLRPFDTVTEGVNQAPTGGIVSIVTGLYRENIYIKKPITLMAPAGTVVIQGY